MHENSCYEYTTVYNQVLLLGTSNQTYSMLSGETHTSIRLITMDYREQLGR